MAAVGKVVVGCVWLCCCCCIGCRACCCLLMLLLRLLLLLSFFEIVALALAVVDTVVCDIFVCVDGVVVGCVFVC